MSSICDCLVLFVKVGTIHIHNIHISSYTSINSTYNGALLYSLMLLISFILFHEAGEYIPLHNSHHLRAAPERLAAVSATCGSAEPEAMYLFA